MSILKTNKIQPTNPGSEDYFLARAWVNFNGTGTVAIRAGGNISSITDRGTGAYGVNYASALTSANYAYSGICGNEDTAGQEFVLFPTAADSTTATNYRTSSGSGAATDVAYIGIITLL